MFHVATRSVLLSGADPPNENHATTTSKAKPAVGTARGIPAGRLG
eukprot:CAMPEP_0118829586 /NCGR_PEP_ID=MMETSP1162-20130426/23466_1 /TAXON_ID=33656 /ORGANISM="Phaeocystis Sp, Strain CCMP2710" /LENGTH=44 /DNA_ID= /DNA_START= /DNA_END= /DNA_ORIENTATION=